MGGGARRILVDLRRELGQLLLFDNFFRTGTITALDDDATSTLSYTGPGAGGVAIITNATFLSTVVDGAGDDESGEVSFTLGQRLLFGDENMPFAAFAPEMTIQVANTPTPVEFPMPFAFYGQNAFQAAIANRAGAAADFTLALIGASAHLHSGQGGESAVAALLEGRGIRAAGL